MRIEGVGRAVARLGRLKASQRAEIVAALSKSMREGVRTAQTLAPDATGQTRAAITGSIDPLDLSAEITVIESGASRAEKDRAYSIEHGRKSGVRGTTEGYHFMHTTRSYLAKRWRGRITRAIRKVARQVAAGG